MVTPWNETERSAMRIAIGMIERNVWREMIPRTRQRRYVWADSSLEATGRCRLDAGYTHKWECVRPSTEQQRCELEGAVMAIEAEVIYCERGSTLYLGLDNTGVEDILLDGFPDAHYAAPLVARAVEALASRGVRLRVFRVPGDRHPADPWSRPSKGEKCVLPTDVKDAEVSRRAVWSYARDQD